MTNLKFKRAMSVLLVLALVLSCSAPLLANGGNDFTRNEIGDVNVAVERLYELPVQERRLLQDAIYEPEFINISELSVVNQALVEYVTKDPISYLVLAEMAFGEVILIYETSDPNVMIAITDNHVDVIKQIDEHTFLINGEKLVFEVTIEYNNLRFQPFGCCCSIHPWDPPMQWSHSNRPPSYLAYSWNFIRTQTVTLTSSNLFVDMATATLAALIARQIWGNQFGASVATSIAALLIQSTFRTNQARHVTRFYNHRTSNMHRREIIRTYAIVNGRDNFSGQTMHYFTLR